MFEDLPQTQFKLIKSKDGTEKPIQGVFDGKLFFIEAAEVTLEDGDMLEWHASDGVVECYEVVDRGFFEEDDTGMSIPAHYQAKLKKIR